MDLASQIIRFVLLHHWNFSCFLLLHWIFSSASRYPTERQLHQLVALNFETSCFFLLLHWVSSIFSYFIETFCLRQVNRKKDSYISWWLWPHKPPASFFYIIDFLLFSPTSLKLFVCVKLTERKISSSAGGFGLTNRRLRSSTTSSFFYFLLLHWKFLTASRYPTERQLHQLVALNFETSCFFLLLHWVSSIFSYFIETFCLRQVNRKKDSYISWWLWPHKPPASFFYIIDFLLFSPTSLKLFVCVKLTERKISSSAGGFGLTNRRLRSSTTSSFFYFLLLHWNFLSASRYPT